MKSFIVLCFVCLPLKNLRLTSSYGNRIHPITGKYVFHAGIDLRANHDTVYAILKGVVIHTGYGHTLGVNIILNHGDLHTIYGHLSQTFVMTGDSVFAGEPIAITGATGKVTGEHLHLSVKYRNKYINPLKFLYQLLKINNHEQQLQTDP